MSDTRCVKGYAGGDSFWVQCVTASVTDWGQGFTHILLVMFHSVTVPATVIAGGLTAGVSPWVHTVTVLLSGSIQGFTAGDSAWVHGVTVPSTDILRDLLQEIHPGSTV